MDVHGGAVGGLGGAGAAGGSNTVYLELLGVAQAQLVEATSGLWDKRWRRYWYRRSCYRWLSM